MADDPNALTRDFKLPTTGRTASTLRRPLGRHHRDAVRIAGSDASMIPFALVAVTTKVDGQPVTAEQLLDFDMTDWQTMMVEVLAGKKS
jgi:hypothetical protein